MGAPATVKRQIEEAEKLHKEVYGDNEVTDEDKNVISQLPGGPDEPEPSNEVVNEPAPEPEPEPEPEKPVDFEQKYNVLQGKYNAEVPRLHAQVKELSQELASMRQVMANFDKVQPVESTPGEKLIGEQDIEDYGADMIDVIKRAAKEELQPIIDKLQKENEQLREALNGVSSTVTETAREALFRIMDSELPNWSEVNHDPGFLAWLEDVDPFSGQKRKAMLTQAFESNDASRVLTFFKSYIQENAAVQPTTTTKPEDTTKVDLVSMAAPGKPHGGTHSSAQGDKRVYSQKEIAKFYRDVQLGLYKDREAERIAIERDILAAPSEGRIR